MKVCFIASHLFNGGFTSSMVSMIHALQKQSIDVSVLFLEPDKNELDTDCLNGAHIIPFQLRGISRRQIFQRIKSKLLQEKISKIGKEIAKRPLDYKDLEIERVQLELLYYVNTYMQKTDLSEYDAVISWEELTCNYFLAYQATAQKKIGYVHPDYRKAKFNSVIDYNAFKRFEFINGVSKASYQTLVEVFPVLAERFRYIPNVLDVESIRDKSLAYSAGYDRSKFQIVTVCRLDNRSKALDRLVKIAKRLSLANCLFEWHIVGDGTDRSIIEKAGINSIVIEGEKKNPYPYIAEADLFVLQSYYEGRPLVVDESIVLKTPVLVTNYQSASEQVSCKEGFIVDNEENAIYTELKNIIMRNTLLPEIKDDNMYKYADTAALIEEIRDER